MLETFFNAMEQLHFQYTEQFLAALPPMAVTVFVHGQGMGLAGRFFRRLGPRVSGSLRTPHRIAVTTGVVAIMLMAHFIEASLWAVFYLLTDMMANFREAMFFSVNAYTTLGASNLTLPGRWKGLDGLESMTAMLMFGWSTAVLAVVVQKVHSIDI